VRVLDDPTRPVLPECIAIMFWRSVHRGIVITDAAEIKLADYGWGDRHFTCGTYGSPAARTAWCANARNGRLKNISTRCVARSCSSPVLCPLAPVVRR